MDESHKERTAQEYYQAFKARLSERGEIRTNTRKPLTAAALKGASLLVVGGPEHPWVFGRDADRWAASEIKAVTGFVAGGGALLMVGDGLGSVERMNSLTNPYGISFSGDLVGDVTVSRADIKAHPITDGVEEICLGSLLGMGGYYLQLEEPATTLAKHDGRPVIACREHGQGRVVVMSSLSAFSGKYIDHQGNSALLRNALDYLLAGKAAGEELPAEKEAPQAQAEPEASPATAKGEIARAKPKAPPVKEKGRAAKAKPPVQEKRRLEPKAKAPEQAAEAQQPREPPQAPPSVQPQTISIQLAQPLPPQETWLYIFGEEPASYQLDFAQHVQQFAQGLAPVPWEAGAAEYARGLRQDGKDDYAFRLPFTVAEPWSPGNYLRRVLYHLTQGRISYFVDAETRRKRGGGYGVAWTGAQINQARFEVRHPITFGDESFLGEWPAALETTWTAAAGGMYLTTHRLLFAADQVWIEEDEEKTAPLPFLSFWSRVDFSNLLRALGMKGIPVLLERRRRPLPDRLAPCMWFEPASAWREDGNVRIIAITGWDLDLVFLEGQRGGDGQTAPSKDQSWAFVGHRVTRTDRREEFVAMIPHLIVPKGKGVEEGMRRSLDFLRPRTVALDALQLVTFAKVARDNGLLHSADPVSWPVPLGDAPQQI